MKYNKTITLKDGKTCTIRNATEQDAKDVLSVFVLTHEQTDFLTTYPEETSFTLDREKEYLKDKADNEREIELVAEIGGTIVGMAGIAPVGKTEKVKHRVSFGVCIEKSRWGLGVGRALTEACIECARKADYIQIELEVVSENTRALALYQSVGFVEYGRNPKGFRSRTSGWQEIVHMRLELDRYRNK